MPGEDADPFSRQRGRHIVLRRQRVAGGQVQLRAAGAVFPVEIVITTQDGTESAQMALKRF